MTFAGTAGSIRVRGTATELSLGAPGRISGGGKTLSRPGETAPSLRDRGLLTNGDFEADGPLPFAWQDGAKTFPAKAVMAPVEPLPQSKKSLELNFEAAGSSAFWTPVPLFVDNTATYRVGFKVWADSTVHISAGGSATTASGQQVKNANGEVWDYRLAMDGPTHGWQQVETTVGPEGSAAAYHWPRDIVSTGLTFWVTAPKGLSYVDNVIFERVPTTGAGPTPKAP